MEMFRYSMRSDGWILARRIIKVACCLIQGRYAMTKVIYSTSTTAQQPCNVARGRTRKRCDKNERLIKTEGAAVNERMRE
jgi:hypothetical protein